MSSDGFVVQGCGDSAVGIEGECNGKVISAGWFKDREDKRGNVFLLVDRGERRAGMSLAFYSAVREVTEHEFFDEAKRAALNLLLVG